MTTPRPLRITFVLLFLLFVAALVNWALAYLGVFHAHWVEEWAPHIAATTFELLVAAAVVDGLLRRQEARQLRPRREVALARLGGALSRFLTSLYVQYAYMGSADEPPARDGLVHAWTGALGTAKQSWLPQWLAEVNWLSSALDDVIRRYEGVLDNETIAMVDKYVQSWNQEQEIQLRLSYEMTKVAAVTLGTSDPDSKALTDEQVRLMHDVVSAGFSIMRRYEDIAGEIVVAAPNMAEQFRLARIARMVPAT